MLFWLLSRDAMVEGVGRSGGGEDAGEKKCGAMMVSWQKRENITKP